MRRRDEISRRELLKAMGKTGLFMGTFSLAQDLLDRRGDHGRNGQNRKSWSTAPLAVTMINGSRSLLRIPLRKRQALPLRKT